MSRRRAATNTLNNLIGLPGGMNVSRAGSDHDDGRKAFSTCTPAWRICIILLVPLFSLALGVPTNRLRSSCGGKWYSRWPEVQATCLFGASRLATRQQLATTVIGQGTTFSVTLPKPVA